MTEWQRMILALRRMRIKQRQIAKLVGVTDTTVHRWASIDITPTADNAQALREVFKRYALGTSSAT